MGGELLETYFKENKIGRQHFDSYNRFIEKGIQNVVEGVGYIEPDIEGYKLKFGRIRLERPVVTEADGSRRKITPMEARLRNMSYMAPIFLEIIPVINNIERGGYEVFIGELPVMVKSKLCHLDGMTKAELIECGEDPNDFGGYFIINGTERVLVSIEDLASNRIMVSKEKEGALVTAKVFSTRLGFRARCAVERTNEGLFRIVFPTAPKNLSLVSVLRALGLGTDEKILGAFPKIPEIQNDVLLNIEADENIKTTEDAIEALGKKAAPGQATEYRVRRVDILLDSYLLPHLGIEPKDRLSKAYYLCKMVEKAVLVAYKIIGEDDKDHYSNKRIKLTGDLMEELFRYAFQFLIKDVSYQIERAAARGRKLIIQTFIRPDALTERILYSMATGNWIAGQTGVSQLLDRINYLSTMSHMRRLISPLSRKHPHFKARDLHGTHWGKICVGKNTTVLLSDGVSTRSMKELEKCWKHHSVLTYNTNTNLFIPSSIIDYQKLDPSSLNKKVFKVVVESGRELIATEDHPIWGEKGWKDMSEIKVGDEVYIYPALEPISENKKIGRKLDGILRKFFGEEELTPNLIKNEKLCILARLFGFIITDGHVGNSIEFYCGSEEDAQAINKDIERLGFGVSRIEMKRSKIFRNNKNIWQRTYGIIKAGKFKRLMLLLGIPKGRRTDIKYGIPSWIRNGSLGIKREFLAGYLGGDGAKPGYYPRKERKTGLKIRLPELVFYKTSDLAEEGMKFANELCSLFEEFGVKIEKIEVKGAHIRKDGKEMKKFILKFANSKENVGRLTQKIGYRYSKAKERISLLVGEYLRICKYVINEREKLKCDVFKLYKQGMAPKEIASFIGLNKRVVKGWLYEWGRYDNTRRTSKLLEQFDKWIKRRVKEEVVLEKVIKKQAVRIKDVRDFTTEKETHTFIANGFITHNCPNESPEGPSCALVKNMALLCEISIGEDKKDILEIMKKIGVHM